MAEPFREEKQNGLPVSMSYGLSGRVPNAFPLFPGAVWVFDPDVSRRIRPASASILHVTPRSWC